MNALRPAERPKRPAAAIVGNIAGALWVARQDHGRRLQPDTQPPDQPEQWNNAGSSTATGGRAGAGHQAFRARQVGPRCQVGCGSNQVRARGAWAPIVTRNRCHPHAQNRRWLTKSYGPPKYQLNPSMSLGELVPQSRSPRPERSCARRPSPAAFSTSSPAMISQACTSRMAWSRSSRRAGRVAGTAATAAVYLSRRTCVTNVRRARPTQPRAPTSAGMSLTAVDQTCRTCSTLRAALPHTARSDDAHFDLPGVLRHPGRPFRG